MRPPESYIGQPIRSLQTMLRLLAELDPQYVPLIPDGIYGPETMQAVAAFQRKHALPVTGVTDQCTWETIVDTYEPALEELDSAAAVTVVWNPGQVIRKGETHPNVYLVQSMLHVMSDVYHSVGQPSMSGLMDELTADAVSSFQMLSGLPMTGNLDRVTWKHLASQYPLAASRQISCG